MSDLLPCPFCGGIAAFGAGSDSVFVNCTECLASTNILIQDIGPETQAEAATAWNTRVGATNQRTADLEAECVMLQEIVADYMRMFPTGEAALEALIDNPGKEVMPDVSGSARPSHDAAPASPSAGGGALPRTTLTENGPTDADL